MQDDDDSSHSPVGVHVGGALPSPVAEESRELGSPSSKSSRCVCVPVYLYL